MSLALNLLRKTKPTDTESSQSLSNVASPIQRRKKNQWYRTELRKNKNHDREKSMLMDINARSRKRARTTCSSHSWLPRTVVLMDKLITWLLAAHGYHVVAPDLRRYGVSDCPQDPSSHTINSPYRWRLDWPSQWARRGPGKEFFRLSILFFIFSLNYCDKNSCFMK